VQLCGVMAYAPSADPFRTVAFTNSAYALASFVIQFHTARPGSWSISLLPSFLSHFPFSLLSWNTSEESPLHQNVERALQLHDLAAGLHFGNLLSKPRHGELHSYPRWKHHLCRYLPVAPRFAARAMSLVPNLDLYDWDGFWRHL
jgi:hypothetical protein